MAIIKKFRIKSFKKINSIIEFENVSLAYGNRLILDNINFKINEGEIFGMLGPNGVGKSTIFNLITGLIKPDSGQIKINNSNVVDFPIYLRTKKFKVGYVPQYGGYFNDLSLIENDMQASSLLTYQIMDFSESDLSLVIYLRMIDLASMKVLTSAMIKVGDSAGSRAEKEVAGFNDAYDIVKNIGDFPSTILQDAQS